MDWFSTNCPILLLFCEWIQETSRAAKHEHLHSNYRVIMQEKKTFFSLLTFEVTSESSGLCTQLLNITNNKPTLTLGITSQWVI